MKKDRQVKAGSSIEAGAERVTGMVRVTMPSQGLGKKTLYKCEFLSPVSIREYDVVNDKLLETYTKSRTSHILYRNQFEVLDF